MAVTYRSSSSTGTGAFVTSRAVPVPAGAATDDIAIVGLERWEASNPAVTPAAGFAQVLESVSGSLKLNVYWKRLSGADSGTYTFSWSGQQWAAGMAILIPGALVSGDPIGSNFSSALATGTAVPELEVTTLQEPFLVHLVATDDGPTGTPPTDFTEVQDSNSLKLNYRIPATIGTHIATGGTLASSVDMIAALIVVAPAATAPEVDIGEDSWAVVGGTFGRVAVENDTGSAIVAREWKVISGPEDADNVVGDQVMSTWTPTVTGSYVIRYTATNGIGATYDELNLEVGAAIEGPDNSLMKR